MSPHKFTDIERKILDQLDGKVSYGERGRPSNTKKKLIAQILAVTAWIETKKQIKDETK